jgi:anti-sigma regulatory factor (Ser/Thr protein kinase)
MRLQLSRQDLTAVLQVPASMDHWDEAMDFIATQAGAYLQNQSTIYKLRLACEEILSNVIRETSDDLLFGREIRLWISSFALYTASPPAFAIRIEDDGPHYDPHLGVEREVNIDLPINERKPGGLGLYLVQQSVDIAEYHYIANRNTYCLAVRM